MAKRKAEYPKDAFVQRKERPKPVGLQWLPDSLIEKVIQYNRPREKETKSFWKWLCQMSATCPAFRRVVLSSCSGSSPLTPSLLNLDDENDKEDYCIQLVKLMDTIGISDWMGTNILCVRADVHTRDVANALLRVLCSRRPCFPKLTEVDIRGYPEYCFRSSDSHLYQMAKIHPLLSSLMLQKNFVFGASTSPEIFESIATFLPNLKRLGMLGSPYYEKGEHLDAFLSKAGVKLTALSLSHLGAGVADSIASHCHYLDTLILQNGGISVRSMTKILRSTPNLVHLDLSSCFTSNEGLLDTIIENAPKLTTFRAQGCDWIDDDGLMRLFDRQIEFGGGKMSLTTLGIYNEMMGFSGITGPLTPAGLRKALIKWRETGPLLPLSLEILTNNCLVNAYFQPLIDEFPEVTFKKLWLCLSFD